MFIIRKLILILKMYGLLLAFLNYLLFYLCCRMLVVTQKGFEIIFVFINSLNILKCLLVQTKHKIWNIFWKFLSWFLNAILLTFGWSSLVDTTKLCVHFFVCFSFSGLNNRSRSNLHQLCPHCTLCNTVFADRQQVVLL